MKCGSCSANHSKEISNTSNKFTKSLSNLCARFIMFPIFLAKHLLLVNYAFHHVPEILIQSALNQLNGSGRFKVLKETKLSKDAFS